MHTTISVDQFVSSHHLSKVDFIKADIKGAECLMLTGAVENLRKFAPKLSICTYHQPDDKEIFEGIILKTNPNYVIEHKWRSSTPMFHPLPKQIKPT
jgi:hypothetical protein